MNEEQKTEAFVDDETIPFETIVCYSKTQAIASIKSAISIIVIVSIILIIISRFSATFLILASIFLVPLAISSLYELYQSYNNYRKAIRKEPEIMMNEDGIQIVNMKFYPWNRIKISINKYNLTYNYGIENKIPITSYDNNKTELQKLLKVYRWRFQEKNPQIDMNEIEKEIEKERQEAIEKTKVFVDDKNIAFETRVYYSKNSAILGLVFYMLVVAVFIGIFIYLSYKKYSTLNFGLILGYIIMFGLFGLFSFFYAYHYYQNYRQALKNEAQIIINEQGMQTLDTKFLTWDTIFYEEIVYKSKFGKDKAFYLEYEYEQDKESFLLKNEYNIPDNLEYLLKIYRGRFEQQQKNKELGL